MVLSDSNLNLAMNKKEIIDSLLKLKNEVDSDSSLAVLQREVVTVLNQSYDHGVTENMVMDYDNKLERIIYTIEKESQIEKIKEVIDALVLFFQESDTIQLIKRENLPHWFDYPAEFLKLIEQNLIDFDPWIILNGDLLKEKFMGLNQRYSERDLLPFARRLDNDDVACWEKGKEGIVIIHDYASPGYEQRETYTDFKEWTFAALETTFEHGG